MDGTEGGSEGRVEGKAGTRESRNLGCPVLLKASKHGIW